MNFIIYDLIFLFVFLLVVSIFLYKNKKNVKKEGILLLYRTKIGVNLIKKFGDKHKKLLNVLSYVSVITGIILMISSLLLFFSVLKTYIFDKALISQIKVPPVMPLLPYIPQLFKMPNIPSFYFSYWIISLAIVAITHEFSHGIFAINKGIKIKNTGFGFFPFFFPVFLAAFVEIDEKKMERKKIFNQLSVLSAGTFSNIILGIIFLIILAIYFSFAFIPSGVNFDSYSLTIINSSQIQGVNNISLISHDWDNILSLVNNQSWNRIKLDNNKTYLIDYKNFVAQEKNYEKGQIIVYEDLDAINQNITGTIIKINGINIRNVEDLAEVLSKYEEGDKIIVTTFQDSYDRDYQVTLKNNSLNNPSIGIGIFQNKKSWVGNAISSIFPFKESNVYYKTKGEYSEFFYYLLWWIVLINFSVAILNMLPAGIFDGGRFFYLICLYFTKDKKKSEKIFKIMTFVLLFGLFLMMTSWLINAIL